MRRSPTPGKTTPESIIGRGDRVRDESALETIGRHSLRDSVRVEVGRDPTARRAAGRNAALDVRAQGLSLFGRLRPIDPGLLWIAKLGAARLGSGKGMACALSGLPGDVSRMIVEDQLDRGVPPGKRY